MIHPIRAAIHAAVGKRPICQPCYGSRLAWPQWVWAKPGCDRLSCTEGTRVSLSRARADVLACQRLRFPAYDPVPPLACRETPRRWEPWPVEAPFIDRIDIHWPGDDWPPAQPPIMIEDQSPDAPSQIILWREAGGLLDMWA